MKYGVFSDVHGNLEAFEAVLKEFVRLNIERYVFLGDIVGYGADAIACLHLLQKLVREKGCLCVAGNHDHAVCGLCGYSSYNEYAKAAIEWTKKQLGEEENIFLSRLPYVANTEHFTIVHANLDKPQAWEYVFDIDDAVTNFRLMTQPVCFIGHSHRPVVFKAGQSIDWFVAQDIPIELGFKYLINIGSVGQPRDGDPRASYAVYDTEQGLVSINRVDYDIQRAQEKIIASGLPMILAERLRIGK